MLIPSPDPSHLTFDHVPLGLAVLDEDLSVRFWNSTLEQWTGLDRSRLLGRSMTEVSPQWGLPQYRERLSQVVQGGPPVIFSPVLHPDILPTSTFEARVFNIKAASLPRSSGGFQILLSVEDITVLSQRISRLRELQKKSDLLMREIHHRVKNNLNMISGLISLQADRVPEDQARPFFDLQSRIIAISQVHDVLYHTDDLGMGKAADYLGPLARLLDRNLSMVDHHQLRLELDPTLAFSLDTTISLGLIQTELMTNALKYGLRDVTQGQLSIWLRRLDGGWAEYGLSQSSDNLPTDFDPQVSQGLGMQLLLTYSRQLGGELRWETGNPTKFFVRFPVTV